MANPVPDVIGAENTVELGLDISSSCVGWSLGVDRELANFGKLVFKSTAEIGEKLLAFEAWFTALLETYNPERILFEKVISRKGNVTQRHAELMGIARKVWRARTGEEILGAWLIPATTVKRVMNVERGRNHAENKRRMVEKINDVYGLSLAYHRSSKLKTDDDTADAIAVLTTYWRSLKKER